MGKNPLSNFLAGKFYCLYQQNANIDNTNDDDNNSNSNINKKPKLKEQLRRIVKLIIKKWIVKKQTLKKHAK